MDVTDGRTSGAAWQKTGASGPFLAIEIDAGAAIADAVAALLRGEDRLGYLAFTNEKKPDGGTASRTSASCVRSVAAETTRPERSNASFAPTVEARRAAPER